MTATKGDFFALDNHANERCVALDSLVERFTSLLVGDREPSIDDAVEYLRRDMRRERNKAIRTILRVIRSDLHKGKSPEDVAAFSDALSAMIRSHSRDCEGPLEDLLAQKTDIDCVERPLEVKVLRGEGSRATLQKLGRTLRHEEQKIEGCERAVNERLYGRM